MKFRKKPVVIDAIQYTGANKIAGTCLGGGKPTYCGLQERGLHIHTLEGVMEVKKKDWVIRGVKGELYPCKPDIFKATYEKV